MIEVAKAHELDFAVDTYPHYASDAEATLKAGNDVLHGLIGPGVYASHGYERTHRDGVRNTFNLIRYYLA
jgi:putative aminopeptidase FrvX